MKNFIFITGDYNDGDMVESFAEIDEQHLPIVKRVAQAIKNCDAGHNWPYYDSFEAIVELYNGILDAEEITIFIEYIPSGGYEDEIHSIEEIKLYEVSDVTDLL